MDRIEECTYYKVIRVIKLMHSKRLSPRLPLVLVDWVAVKDLTTGIRKCIHRSLARSIVINIYIRAQRTFCEVLITTILDREVMNVIIRGRGREKELNLSSGQPAIAT